MSDDVGRLKLKLKPGESVQVGEAMVTFTEQRGESVYLVFEASRSVPIVRSGLLDDADRRRNSRASRRSAS